MRCPYCGRFVGEDGFYGKRDDGEFAVVAIFCNEKCYDSWRKRRFLPPLSR